MKIITMLRRSILKTNFALATTTVVLLMVLAVMPSAQALSPMEARISDTCTAHQIQICINASNSNTLHQLPSGGHCEPGQKDHHFSVRFTMTCISNQYHPGVDQHCCCASQDKLYCCPYHHDHTTFRCTGHDVIGLFSSATLDLFDFNLCIEFCISHFQKIKTLLKYTT